MTRENRLAFFGALGVFLLILAMGEIYLRARANAVELEISKDSLALGSKLRAEIERELNSLLYLNSGLASYIAVRKGKLEPGETQDILRLLHQGNKHIRNFGIAIGYTVRYVYPLAGNEAAVGLYYPNVPEQWPTIKRIIDSRTPVLTGPVNLVQGGRSLIYRVPLYIDDRYWGLLSTVINMDSFVEAISSGASQNQYEFAIRGKDASGFHGGMVVGRDALFADRNASIQEITVPGGSWILAVKPIAPHDGGNGFLLERAMTIMLGLLAGWMMFLLIRSRFELAELALYDQLTGLPNRHLLEDRAAMVFARQKRSPDEHSAILFLDLDGFKDINDRFGHKAGDAVLMEVARRARRVVRSNDTVARWGGDEFIILLENIDQSTLDFLITRLTQQIEAPIVFDGKILQVGVSVGQAICDNPEYSFDQALKVADSHMYQQKKRHKPASATGMK
jgi:diguanylate cyclase (GGDEF)-like protein